MSSPPCVFLGARIPPRLNERLRAAAERENNRVGAIVRRLLTDGLNREEKAREETSALRKRAS